ncbi:hypothetical protein [Streptomyces zagrosensis]|uniref:Uncharacterized protein n=1 Tax=Streptomyces zagrosensis TaxID=1042984 RepID=A0A7W9QCT6_9ACTN|nr:hypothetical protein [Streptomyces zagrosensis]MBB5937729.1 hypothetical protein [Streptomyces zagrosensis]
MTDPIRTHEEEDSTVTDHRKAPSAAEELEQEVENAETDVTEERNARHDSEAGDTLTPSPAAQRQASASGRGEGGGEDRPAP